MPRAIGIGIGMPFVRRSGAANPDAVIEALFANSEVGAWYDPSDLSTMWQDTAGTTPVTTAGQAVARIDDKSGRGNHWLQATEAARPLYQLDGTLPYLSFDGVDDILSTSGTPIPLRRGAVTAIAMRYASGGASAVYLGVAGPGATTNIGIIGIRQSISAANAQTRGASLGIALVAGPATATNGFLADVNAVLALKFTDSSQTLSVNGSDLTPSAHTWGVSDSISVDMISGANAFGVARRIYGKVHVARNLTAQEFTDLNTWLSGKAGL